jgi:hypothetical protein
VATAETEQAWRAWAKGRRSREIEQTVAARHRGDGPEDGGDSSLVKHSLRFEVRAETMALFRDAQAAIRAELGGSVDDDTLLYEIARRILGGPDEAGRASYQVAVTHCEGCGRTSIDAGGESHPVDDVVAEMAACDAQHIRLGGSRPSPDEGASTPGDRGRARSTRIAVPAASPHTGAPTPGDQGRGRSTGVAARAASPPMGAATPGDRGRARCIGIVALGASPHMGAPTPTREGAKQTPRASGPPMGAPSSKRTRATQTIPPAVRREVLRRDRRRCVVPGCRNHIFLDVHHLDPRAEGGGHDPERLASLCGCHHPASTWVTSVSTAWRAKVSRFATVTGRPMARRGRRGASISRASPSSRSKTWVSERPRRESSSMPCSPWSPCRRILVTSFARHCGRHRDIARRNGLAVRADSSHDHMSSMRAETTARAAAKREWARSGASRGQRSIHVTSIRGRARSR